MLVNDPRYTGFRELRRPYSPPRANPNGPIFIRVPISPTLSPQAYPQPEQRRVRAEVVGGQLTVCRAQPCVTGVEDSRLRIVPAARERSAVLPGASAPNWSSDSADGNGPSGQREDEGLRAL
jgi:hypothetical protein